MSMHPRDEFDDVPESPRRQGIHRTRGEAASDTAAQSGRGLRWILAAGVAALVIGALAFFVLPRLGLSSSPASADSPAAASATAPGSAEPSAAPSASASPSAPSPSSASSRAGADKALEVGVYNGSTTAGLGNRVATAARNAGWNVTAVANWAGTPVSSSVVYYKTAAQEASARALAADTGITTVLQAPALGLPLAVVVGPGYAG